MNPEARRRRSIRGKREHFDRREAVDTMGTNVFSSKDHRSLHKGLNAEFILYQIFLDQIFDQDKTLPVVDSTLLEYFQPDDPNDQRLINEFDQEYQAEKAIHWYTRESPIYRILNKALRTHNIDDLIPFGQFIRDLHQQLKEQKILFAKAQKSSILTLYRGQFISKDEIKRLQSTQGELISVNSFLSTSSNKEKALQFATSRSPPNDKLTNILLEIFVSIKSPSRPLAGIQHLSAFPEEEEVLFVLGSIFRIDHIFFDDDLQLWRVKLTLCADGDLDMQDFLSSLDQELQGQNKFVSLGNYFIQMQKYREAEEHYLTLIDENLITYPQEFAYCFFGLAQVNDKKKNYQLALRNLQTALDYIIDNQTTNDHILLSQIYNYLGTIYTKQALFSIAIQSYEKALNTNNNVPSTTYQGLAHIQFQLDNHLLALEYFDKALQAEDDQAHTSIAKIYIHMGNVFAAMNNKDKASDMFDKAIESQLKFLPEEHPDLAYTYSALGMMYSKINDQEKAFHYIEKAHQLQLQSLPNNHLDFAQTYKDFAHLHMIKEDFDQALIFYHLALENQVKSLEWDHPSVAETYLIIGEVHAKKKKEYDQALIFYHQVMDSELARAKEGDRSLSIAFENLATVYQEKGDEDQALIFYHKQLDNELKVKLNEDISLAHLYKSIAEIYYKKRLLSQSLIHYNRLLDCHLRKETSNEKEISELYSLIGKVYLKKKDFSERLLYYEKWEEEGLKKARSSEELVKVKLSDGNMVKSKSSSSAHANIDNIHFEKRHLDQAMHYFEKYLHKQLNDDSTKVRSIGESYQILGNICFEKRNLNGALDNFLKLLENRLRREKTSDSSLSDIYKIIGSIYLEKNQLNEALISFNRLIDCRLKKKKSFEEKSVVQAYQLLAKVYLIKDYLNQKCNSLHPIIKNEFGKKSFNNSMEIIEKNNSKDFRIEKHNLERSLFYFQHLLDKQMKNQSLKLYSLQDLYRILANLFFEKEDFFRAIFYFEQLLNDRLMKSREGDISLSNIYALIGLTYFKQGSLDQSFQYYQRALSIAQRINPRSEPFIDKLKCRMRQILLPNMSFL